MVPPGEGGGGEVPWSLDLGCNSWWSALLDGRFSPNQGASERPTAQPRPPRLLPPPGDPELRPKPGARGEEGRKGREREVRPGPEVGKGGQSTASPEPAAECHLQPRKEAPAGKMPSVASCRCSQEPERQLADWGGSGAYVFIGLTLQCPWRKGRLRRAGAGERERPRSLRAQCRP